MVIVNINTEKYVGLCGAALEDAYLAFVRHPRRVRSASRALSSAAAATVVLLDGEESRSSFYLLTQSFTVSLST